MTEPITQTPDTEPTTGEVQDDDATLQTQSVERDGQQMVPASVVREQREKRRALEDKVKSLEEQAKTAEQLKTYAAQTQPLMQVLQKHPDLVQELQKRLDPNYTPPEAGNGQSADPRSEKIAKLIDIYESSGKIDSGRAKALRDVLREDVEELLNERLTPVQQSQVTEKAQQNYQWLSTFRGDFEKPVDRQILDTFVQNMSHEELANPDTPWRLYAMVRGLESVKAQQGRVPPPGQEPVFTEASGGLSKPTALTDNQKRLARELGRSESDVLKDLTEAIENDGVIEQ